MRKLVNMLDEVANRVEAKGCIKEAYEIDKISDMLDSGMSEPQSAFPIRESWTPGEYGDFGEFQGKIKEAAGFGMNVKVESSI